MRWECPHCDFVIELDVEFSTPVHHRCGSSPSVLPMEAGPGAEMVKLLQSYGIPTCQLCKQTARKMNQLGPSGCRDEIDNLIAEVRQNMEAIGGVARIASYIPLATTEAIRQVILKACKKAEHGSQD